MVLLSRFIEAPKERNRKISHKYAQSRMGPYDFAAATKVLWDATVSQLRPSRCNSYVMVTKSLILLQITSLAYSGFKSRLHKKIDLEGDTPHACLTHAARPLATSALDAQLHLLVDEYRCRCLWFLREDYYPATKVEPERVLHLIERHGDLQALRRVAALRAWLSRDFNETSAAF
jgi:hypothetical protein